MIKKTIVAKSLKSAVAYCVLFLFVFNAFFLQTISDGDQTSNMFIFISIILSLIIIALFVFITQLIKPTGIKKNVLFEGVLLYLLGEFSVFCLTQEISFFGLLYKTANHVTLDSDILSFRMKRNYSLSMSFLIAAFLYALIKPLLRKIFNSESLKKGIL